MSRSYKKTPCLKVIYKKGKFRANKAVRQCKDDLGHGCYYKKTYAWRDLYSQYYYCSFKNYLHGRQYKIPLKYSEYDLLMYAEYRDKWERYYKRK